MNIKDIINQLNKLESTGVEKIRILDENMNYYDLACLTADSTGKAGLFVVSERNTKSNKSSETTNTSMEQTIKQILMKMNEKELIYDLTELNASKLKRALKQEGINKHSKPSDIKKGILDLFDTVGPCEFGVCF